MPKLIGHMGAHPIEVRIDKRMKGNYATYGQTPTGRKISLSAVLNDDPMDLVNSFIHESLHAAGDTFGFDDKETVVSMLATALTQFWTEIGLVDPQEWARKLKKDRK